MREWLGIQRYVWGWRARHWRCVIFGHKWGDEHRHSEAGYHYESWVDCERCEAYGETWYWNCGRTSLGLELDRKRG